MTVPTNQADTDARAKAAAWIVHEPTFLDIAANYLAIGSAPVLARCIFDTGYDALVTGRLIGLKAAAESRGTRKIVTGYDAAGRIANVIEVPLIIDEATIAAMARIAKESAP